MIFRYSVPPSWYEGVYQDRTAPCKAARPFTLSHKDGSDKAVLLVHGYAGYPGELVRPARDLYEKGFDVYVPRLPGCGTTGEDFMRSRASDWLGVAANAASDLSQRYSSFSMLGHSMGAALVILASGAVDCDRIVLASPAVSDPSQRMSPSPLSLTLLSLFRRRIPKDWAPDSSYVMYYEDAPADDAYLGREYWSWTYMRQSGELLSLMRKAGKSASSLKSPVLIISGGDDQVTGPQPADFLDRTVPEHVLVRIPECSHFPFYDRDKKGEEKAVGAVLSFLS